MRATAAKPRHAHSLSEGMKTDPGFIQGLRDGKPHDWEKMYDLYKPWLALELRRRWRVADADDLVQEVFVEVSRKIDEFVPSVPGAFRGFLWRVAWCKANGQYRQSKVRGRNVGLDKVDLLDSNDHVRAFDQVEHLQLAEKELYRKLKRLSPATYAIFKDRTVEDLSYEELAIKHKMTVAAIGSRLTRFNKQLQVLRDEYRDAMSI